MLTVYKASAGSGKTFSLAYEYIKLVLGIKGADGAYRLVRADDPAREPRRHRFILAITFTNAATEEMKARIIKELDILAHNSAASNYLAGLTRDFRCGADELSRAAALALTELLLDYDHFNVSTIDAFFQSVLRTFSHDLDLQGDYSLSLDSDDILRQSLSQLLDKVNYDSPDADIEQWISSFTSMKMDQSRNFNVFDRNGSILESLSQTAKRSLGEDFKPYAAATEDYLTDPDATLRFYKWCNSTADALYNDAGKALADALAAAERNGGRKILNRYLGAALYDSYPRYIKERKGGPTKSQKAWTEATELPVNKIVCSGDPRKLPDCDRIAAEIEPYAMDAIRALDRAATLAGVLVRMADAVWTLRFAGFASHELNTFMRENNTLLIEKSSELISGLLGKGDVPFIYERVGTYLRHLLIDEFQDTSRSQWDNLKPLVDNALGYGHDCLIIGDVKQAIYRFRNSDSSLLDHEVETRDFPAPRHTTRGSDPADNTNHRSARGIVRFNNTVFRDMAARLGISAYGGVVQELVHPSGSDPEKLRRHQARLDSAYIRAVFSGKSVLEDEDDDVDDDVFAQMAEQIRRQHSSGYRWKDILILARGKQTVRDAVAYLRACNPPVPVISEDSLLLSNSPAVRSVMATLALVLNGVPQSDHAEETGKYASRAEATNMLSRFNYFSSRNPGDMAAAILQAADDDTDSALYDIVDRIRRENPTNVVATLEAIIYHTLGKVTDFPAPVCSERRGEAGTRPCTRGISVCHDIIAEQAYLAALVDRAIEHLAAPDPSPAAFLQSYTRHLDTWAIAVPATADAVVAMTIHKSKGLEAECVHIPNLDWQLYKATEMWLPLDTFSSEPIPDAPPTLHLKVFENDALLDPGFGRTAQVAAANIAAEKADAFNMAYVAFTRARHELCVWGHAAATDAVDTVSKLLFTSITEPSDICGDPRLMDLCAEAATFDIREGTGAKGAKVFAGAVIEYGSPTVFTPEEAAKGGDGTLSKPLDTVMPPYSVIYRDDARMFTAIDDILSPDDEDDPLTEADEAEGVALLHKAAMRGNHIHAILAEMRCEDDLERAAAHVARRCSIPRDTLDGYIATLREAFARSQQARAWFAADVIADNERSIYNPAKDETLRPDRIVRMPDGATVVIDYKFTTEERPVHAYKLRQYIELVRRMDGVRPRGFLWYPDLDIIKEV